MVLQWLLLWVWRYYQLVPHQFSAFDSAAKKLTNNTTRMEMRATRDILEKVDNGWSVEKRRVECKANRRMTSTQVPTFVRTKTHRHVLLFRSILIRHTCSSDPFILLVDDNYSRFENKIQIPNWGNTSSRMRKFSVQFNSQSLSYTTPPFPWCTPSPSPSPAPCRANGYIAVVLSAPIWNSWLNEQAAWFGVNNVLVQPLIYDTRFEIVIPSEPM